MHEKDLMRRELAKQTALLFVVFAVLFALLGLGIYSMVSANVFRTADDQLLSAAQESGLVALDAVPDDAGSADAGGAPLESDLSLSLQQDIIEANPQFITLVRDERGALLETVGLYATYPSFLEDVPFDPNDVDRVYQTEAGGHAYRGITFPLEEAERTYLQVLVNVDAELAILDGFTRTLVLYLAAAVVAAAAASYLLSRRTLKPIVQNWKAQTEFVQNASHELRTPLAVVQATGELLLDHPESRIVDRFEDVNVITEETKRLARLVDSLMELSLDDAGRAQPNRQPVEVDGLVRDVAALYEDFAALQGKQVRFEPGFGGTVPADADRLRQLLAIVLDNAVKYTAAGDEIVVTTGTQGQKCLLTVADTGCGIDPEDRERVFERFFRADKARSRATGGHGLGLSLAQSIVQAHGGTIRLVANEPRGTVVTITLPR